MDNQCESSSLMYEIHTRDVYIPMPCTDMYERIRSLFTTFRGVRRKKFRGGGSRVWPASSGVRLAEPPGRRRIFENLQKDS